MTETELYYLLALQKVVGVGDIIAKKLLHHCGSAETIFTSSSKQLATIDGIGKMVLKNLQDKTIFDMAKKELAFIQSTAIQTSFFKGNNYPERLKHCLDAPVLLFSTGNINWNNSKIISIVGTRQVTQYGMDFCKKLIADIAPLNPIIVSGFAYGVDIVAHQAAIDNNLQTIGVLAHGLNQIYPSSHKKYMQKVEQNGGFLTEFWSSSSPEKENFVKRNRIVAGISEATIVIESAEKGGSLITANIANDYNRDVFAVPGRITDKYSQGCNTLIKTQQAHLLSSAADLVYILNWEISKPLSKKDLGLQKELFINLTTEEQSVYDFLIKNGKTELDSLAIHCDFPTYKLIPLLLNMELKGILRPLPGKMFEITG